MSDISQLLHVAARQKALSLAKPHLTFETSSKCHEKGKEPQNDSKVSFCHLRNHVEVVLGMEVVIVGQAVHNVVDELSETQKYHNPNEVWYPPIATNIFVVH